MPLSAASVVYLFLFFIMVALRIGYRYELEWLEGLMVEHVDRILHGQPIYVEPSIDFIPSIYAPLYYYVSAAFAKLFGIGFLPLRLVSLLSTIGMLLLIFDWVKRETGERTFGLVAAGLYIASFRACGAWFDLARGDALFLFLLLAGFYMYRIRSTTLAHMLAACLLAGSFFTKQSALLATLPLLAVAVWQYRSRAIAFLITYFALVIAGVLVLNWSTDNWFYYYCFTLPGKHAIAKDQILGFWTHDILRYAAVSLILSVWWVIVLYKRSKLTDSLFWSAAILGMIGSAWSSRMHSGGYDNVLMPAFAVLALLSGLALFGLSRNTHNETNRTAIFLMIAVLVQFGLFWFNPAAQIPNSKDREAGDLIIERIRQTEGEIWIPYHSYLAEMAGKKSYAHRMAFGDVTRADSTANMELNWEIFESIKTRKFAVILLDTDRGSEFIYEYYDSRGNPTGEDSLFLPKTGLPTRPRYWFVPK